MEGGPQRANAAQLAARQIKARPKGRLQGGRPSAASGTRSDPSVQFAPVSQNGGGLFGGSVQGAGTFNFSAPGGINFSTPSFGSNATPSPDVSDSEGRFPGDDRATKRAFGGPSTIQPSQPTFQSSNLFGQSQTNPFGTASQSAPGGNSFSFGSTSGTSGINFNQGNAPASNSFSFGGSSQPAPASPGISFGSGATDSKPANNPFSFGQQTAQPPAPSSPFTFGSSATQEKSAAQPQASNRLFNFGTPAPQEKAAAQPQASNSPFTFGSAATQVKPADTPFLFGQGSAAPSNSSINFGSTPPPMSNLFGTSTSQTAQPTNMFASAGQQSAPANNIFSKSSTGSASTNNLFGSREQSPVPASNVFDSQSQQAPSTTNFFGTSTQPTTKPNLLGEQKQTSTSSIFSGLNKTASTSNIFNNPVKQPASTNNLFGKADQEPAPARDLFPTLNKPVDDSAKQPELNGSNVPGRDAAAASQSPSIFNKNTTSTSLFGQSPSTDNKNSTEKKGSGSKPAFSFGSTSSVTPASTTNNIFSPMKPVDAPTAASQPPPSGMFPSLPQTTKTPQKEVERSRMAATPLNAKHSTADPYSDDDKPLLDPFNITDDQIDPYITKNLDDIHRHNYYTTFRIKSLNKAMAELFENMHPETNPSAILLRYIETRKMIVSDWIEYENKHKGALTNGNAQEKSPAKRPQPVESAASAQSPTKGKADDENQESESPSKRNKEPFSNQPQAAANGGPKLNGLSNGTSGKAIEGVTSLWKPSSASGQIGAFSPTPPVSSPAKGKRKAEDDLTKDTQEESPLRQIKTPRINGDTIGSNTSNLFKHILDSPSKSGGPIKTSPVKKVAPLQESKDDTPRPNPFGSLPVPSSPIKSSASPLQSTPMSTMFTPKATFTPNSFTPKTATRTANLFSSKTTPSASNLFMPKGALTATNPFPPSPAAAPSTTGTPTLKLPVFSTAGGAEFISQFGQKSDKEKEKEFEEAVQKEVDENYESDEDGPMDVYTEGVRARLKAAKEKSASLLNSQKGQGFVFKPSLPTTKPNSDSNVTKAVPELSHKAANATPASTIFSQFSGQNNSSLGAATSALSSATPSRTSTPGPFGSSTGSVFDGPASTNSGPKNIFGHLSNTSSVKGNDEEDSADEEEIDGNEENKDPNYKPGDDNPSSPGTPAEETGAGIASVKKTSFFNGFGTPKVGTPLGASSGISTPTGGLFGRIGTKDVATIEKEQSGTTTPGGSLFDRITKDSNGNPIRHISTEEKENTQPSPVNIFKDLDNPFSKTPGAPTDKTWKPDSPIKFSGDATSDTKSSAPTVSITAATPTKTGNPSNLFGGPSGPTSAPFSNLFGSKDLKPATTGAPLSNLFGSFSTAKGPSSTSVGFGFGAPSVTSSLLPSAAASTTTSRATSPGATTDGESGVDGDPDTEHHEQINLTAGGPGEENEEVLYEVRAKAQKYLGAEEGWVTKGLGPLRVLKHRGTKATRILLRADPSGSIVMNKGLVEQFTYEPNGKTVKVLTTGEDGKVLETWLLQVKTAESAENLAEVLESNKTAS